MKTISYPEYMKGNDGIVDLDTAPFHMRMDYDTRNQNVTNGKELCERCEGTGNEFMSMYRKCTDCMGTGIANPKPPSAASSPD